MIDYVSTIKQLIYQRTGWFTIEVLEIWKNIYYLCWQQIKAKLAKMI